MSITKVALSVALLGASVCADLGKSTWADTLWDITDELGKVLEGPGSTHEQWEAGSMPQSCKDHILEDPPNRCPIEDVTVHTVKYNDCSEPWIFCRCANAPMSLQDAVYAMGDVPVGLRSAVRHVIVLPDQQLNLAGMTTGQDIMLFGQVGGTENPYTAVHESAHAFDESLSYDASSDMQDALNQDSCVVTDYANTNIVEDFAELGVARAYQIKVGALSDLHGDTACFKNQLDYVGNIWSEAVMFPESCDLERKPDASPSVGLAKRDADVLEAIRKREVPTCPLSQRDFHKH